MGTNEWVAIGTLLTAAFTGYAAWLSFRHRARPIIEIELDTLAKSLPQQGTVSVVYAIKNVGTGPAFRVRIFGTAPGLPDKQYGQTATSLPAGEEIKLERRRMSVSGKQEFDETTGTSPEISADFVTKEWGIAVTWNQPPRHRRTRDLRLRESQLKADYMRRTQTDTD